MELALCPISKNRFESSLSTTYNPVEDFYIYVYIKNWEMDWPDQ